MSELIEKLVNIMKINARTAASKAFWLPADTNIPVSKLPKVRRVVYEVTDACNSRCLSCNIWQSPVTKDILTVSEIEKTFSDSLFDELKTIIITGGEPFLRNDLEDIIMSLHKVKPKAKINLSTNGLLPDRVLKVIKFALDKDIDLAIGVSLDAVGEEHDRFRGVPGNFQKVDFLLRELAAISMKDPCKLSVVIGQTLSPLTINYLEEVEKYAQKLCVNYVLQLYEEFTYYSNSEDTRKQLKIAGHIEGAVGHHASDAISDQIEHNNQINALEKLKSSIQNEILIKALKTNKPVMHNTKHTRNSCASMNTFFLLRANGDVTPCLRWSHLPTGNVKEMTPSDIWQSPISGKCRKIVRECSGCSNTWATSWSAEYWLAPFLLLFLKAFIKSKLRNGRLS